MASDILTLKIFVRHCPSVISSVSPSLQGCENQIPSVPACDASNSSSTSSFLKRSKEELGLLTRFYEWLQWFSGTKPPTDESTGDAASTLYFLDTKYGLRVEQAAEKELRISLLLSDDNLSKMKSDKLESDILEAELHSPLSRAPSNSIRYRLFPESHSSFLWYDRSWPHNPKGEYEVDVDDIADHYALLYPSYVAWVEKYEKAFESEICQHGSDELFPDIEVRIAWETEGLLIACWLALQPGVNSVEYSPRTINYKLERGTVGNACLQFFKDTATLLEEAKFKSSGSADNTK